MTFWRRFRLYLLGVGLGLILVMIFFGSRDLSSWTPESRVLTAIDSSDQSYSERAVCQLACLELSALDIPAIQAEASVNFKESNAQKKPCPIYQIKTQYRDEELILIWKVCEQDEKVELMGITSKRRLCDC